MSSEIHTLLLVSADLPRADFLDDQFTADGFEVVCADDRAMGQRSLERTYPDVVLVDAALPDGSGLELLGTLRDGDGTTSRVDPATPVIVLCSGAEPLDRVRALDRGADDVLSMPLHYPELLARTRAVLRRAGDRRREGALRVGPLVLDPVTRTVELAGEEIALSQKEFSLLRILAADPTRVFQKDELLRVIWGYGGASRTRTLDSHACRLRRKLADAGVPFVINVWGDRRQVAGKPNTSSPRGGEAEIPDSLSR